MTNKNSAFEGFGSLAIHGDPAQYPNYSHPTPIYASSTFVYNDA